MPPIGLTISIKSRANWKPALAWRAMWASTGQPAWSCATTMSCRTIANGRTRARQHPSHYRDQFLVRFLLAASVSVFVVALSQAGCASSKPDSRAESDRVLLNAIDQASEGKLSDTDRYAAARLYHAKCARCHKFYDPAAYDQTEWDV